ncbi:MAG: 1-deoxy-D-xylulose-5-phosphate reductoisomerase [Chloroflexota bacterium]|nr:1-deoxy-D-xylulose-5-phosphate reductoisomerase [Chloroflexota bacterium]
MKRLAILGSTGSIGRQTLDIVRAYPDDFEVVGLSAWSNRDLLLEQAREFHPRYLYCQQPLSPADMPDGASAIGGIVEIATHPDVDLVMQGMVGNAGLLPTLEALRAGKQVAMANKEPVVMAGELLTREAARCGGEILPVDSEPSAIWQCLQGEDVEKGVRRLIITASGGALRRLPLEEVAKVTPEQALKHPTWSMGKKITIDSATLMNKGFEVIESHWLFAMPWERVDVVVHPQSIIHSMVEFMDGSVKAQLGVPDMRLPIQYAMFYPQRLPCEQAPRFDPIAAAALTFESMDPARYPCFVTALEAGHAGGTYPTVLSASDEVAIDAFLGGRISFGDIHGVVTAALDRHESIADPTLDEILAADAWARETARGIVGG